MTDVAPSGNKVQQESLLYTQPVSEASITAIAALTSYLREVVLPVGSICESMLDETQFDTQLNASQTRWVLADGRSCVGSTYESITGNTTVPDLRGIGLRGKNGSRSGSTGNPDGDLALGTYTIDRFATHDHNLTDPGHSHRPGSSTGTPQNTEVAFGPSGGCFVTETNGTVNNAFSTEVSTTGITLSNAGSGSDTYGRNVTINYFIRIN